MGKWTEVCGGYMVTPRVMTDEEKELRELEWKKLMQLIEKEKKHYGIS